MNERIRILRKNLNMTQDEFSSKIGLSRNFIAQIETGAKTPSDRTLKDICREFNVNYLWLTEGIGSMQDESDASSMIRIDDIMTGENEFAENVFREFSKLDEDEWKIIEKLIKNLSDNIK